MISVWFLYLQLSVDVVGSFGLFRMEVPVVIANDPPQTHPPVVITDQNQFDMRKLLSIVKNIKTLTKPPSYLNNL